MGGYKGDFGASGTSLSQLNFVRRYLPTTQTGERGQQQRRQQQEKERGEDRSSPPSSSATADALEGLLNGIGFGSRYKIKCKYADYSGACRMLEPMVD